MSIFDKLLVKVIRSKEGVLHFRRWRLFETPWLALYVHCISRSDEDKDPHDHPWWYLSWVLRGGYIEHVGTGPRVREYVKLPGWFSFRKTSDFHKVELFNGPAWTLVLTGPRSHDPWGYWTKDGWVDHVTYRKNKNATPTQR